MRNNNIYSLMVAILICSNQFTFFIGKVLPILLVAYTTIFVVSNLRSEAIKKNSYKWSILVLTPLILFFATTYIFYSSDVTLNLFAMFLSLGAPVLFLSVDKFDSRKILYNIHYFSYVFIPVYMSYDLGEIVDYNTETSKFLMSISYNTLPFICASIFVLIKERRGWLKMLSLLPICYFIYVLLMYGARGAIVSVFAFIILLLYYKIINTNNHIKYLVIATVLCLTAVVVFFLNWQRILVENSNMRFISRFITTSENQGDLSSGRLDIYNTALNNFLNSPIWGNGIGSFDNFSGLYPHNIFIQILSEGGILLSLILMPFIFKAIYKLFQQKYNALRNDNSFMLLFIFCAGFMRLLFSSQLWESIYIWLLIWLVLHLNRVNKLE